MNQLSQRLLASVFVSTRSASAWKSACRALERVPLEQPTTCSSPPLLASTSVAAPLQRPRAGAAPVLFWDGQLVVSQLAAEVLRLPASRAELPRETPPLPRTPGQQDTGGDENGNTGGGAPHAPAILMPKRTFQPHNNRKIKRHGFAKRMSTVGGRLVLLSRIERRRRRLTSDAFRL